MYILNNILILNLILSLETSLSAMVYSVLCYQYHYVILCVYDYW